MSARTLRLAFVVALCLLVAAPLVAAAAPASAPDNPGFSCVSDRAVLSAPGHVAWDSLYSNPPTAQPNTFDQPATGGAPINTMRVEAGPSNAQGLLVGTTASNIFNPNDYILYTNNAGGATPATITLYDRDGGLMFAAGAQIAGAAAPNPGGTPDPKYGVFYARLVAYAADGAEVGSCESGPAGSMPDANGTAPFLGITSTEPFKKVEFSLVPGTNAVQAVDFSINQFDFLPARPLVVAKTVDSVSYSVEPVWTIEKTADQSVVKKAGGAAPLGYTVTLDQTPNQYKYSEQKVVGTISVTNPNPVAVDGVSVLDEVYAADGTTLDPNARCSVETAAPGTRFDTSLPAAPPSDPPTPVVFNYTCTWVDSGPASMSQLKNVASVAWDDTLSSVQDTKVIDWTTGAATWKNTTVTVSDSDEGVIGTVTPADTLPKSFHYQHTAAVPLRTCADFTDTATIDETGQQASATVKVCGPIASNAKDIIFWGVGQGQSILINKCADPNRPVSLGRFLRMYRPFQEMILFQDCQKLALYVQGVELAGMLPASSTPIMSLKAQFLATALNVYFSSEAYGGNILGSTHPIGSLAIDLQNVCVGDCATYEDASPIFGAPALHVLQLLGASGAASTFGGIKWYGGNPVALRLAYETFRAINTQVAFVP
jgi:hypothetical protein